MKRIYLDWAATALPDEDIINNAVEQSLAVFANPSSPHTSGKAASNLIETSRKRVAEAFGADRREIYFTSGGTDSNNIILSSLLNRKRKGNIVISGIEHSSVYEPAIMLQNHGWEVRIVNPEADGIISEDRFCSCIDGDTRLASVMLVNNETGSIQPAARIAERIRSQYGRNCHFHADAVQAAGKIPLNFRVLPFDSASLSSHKFRGPRGAGILFLKRDIQTIYAGGGQEKGVKDGTENTFGIAGTAGAAELAAEMLDANLRKALKLKKILIDEISQIRGVSFNPDMPGILADPSVYSPYILSVNVKPVPGEILVRVMSDRGFDIATGSACATGKKKKSRVMTAMGVDPETAFSTVRISTGPGTTEEEIIQFCNIFVRESTILIDSLR